MTAEKTTKDANTDETVIEEFEVKKTTSKAPSSTVKKGDSYTVTVPLLNIREKASLLSEVKGTLIEGETVSIVTRTPQGFGKLADGSGYIKLEFAMLTPEEEQK